MVERLSYQLLCVTAIAAGMGEPDHANSSGQSSQEFQVWWHWWRPSLLGWRPSLVGWRPFLLLVILLVTTSKALVTTSVAPVTTSREWSSQEFQVWWEATRTLPCCSNRGRLRSLRSRVILHSWGHGHVVFQINHTKRVEGIATRLKAISLRSILSILLRSY